MRIAATTAPGGRTLSDADQIEVAWTVATPADELITDRIERRRTQLLRLIGANQEQTAPTVEDLAAALRSSSATIRRISPRLRAEEVDPPAPATQSS